MSVTKIAMLQIKVNQLRRLRMFSQPVLIRRADEKCHISRVNECAHHHYRLWGHKSNHPRCKLGHK